MKKLRWGRIITLLVILVIIGAALNFCVRIMTPSQSNHEVSLSNTTQKNENKTLSNSQKREMIERAQEQAIKAALASGQTEAEATQFGQLAAKDIEASLKNFETSGKD